MEIIQLSASDEDAMYQLSNYLIRSGETGRVEYIQKLVSDPRSYLLVGLERGLLIGYILAYRFPSLTANLDTAYLYEIEVLPVFRKQGFGKALLREMLTLLKQHQVGEVWLGTAIGNTPAQKLFLSSGGSQEEETFYEFYFDTDDFH